MKSARVSLLLAILLVAGTQSRVAESAELSINSDDEIVYFDGDNVIRIYDPVPSSDVLEVKWASPEGGWSDMALGDVTGDGDQEIIAIRPEESGGRLTIFDPVAQDSPEDQVETLDGVPWARLFDLILPQPPRLLITGEFDRTRPGKEILYSYADGDSDHFVILHATGVGSPGRGWEEQRSWDVEGHWTAIATGNVLLDDPIDEVALVSFDRGELGLFRVEPEVKRVFTNVNRDQRWTDVALGQYVNVDGDGADIGAVRDADFPLASTWVFRYNGSGFVDVLGEQLIPSPTTVFFADLRGNGDDEMIVLRQVTPELGPRQRLIVRDGNNNDTLTLREDLLDGDNEYKGGDGGDIDGDGFDEIVLIRNNRIRIYHEPESSVNYELVERFTNGQTVIVGNVDAAGLAQRPLLSASQTSLSAVLEPGESSGNTTIIIKDGAKGFSMQYSVIIQGATAWIRVSPRTGLTPNELTVSFTAEGIPPGDYSGRLLVDVAGSNVDNNPLVIDLSLRVKAAVEATPASADFLYFSCTEPYAPTERSIRLSAPSALSYTAQIEGEPSWVTVSPEAGVLPEQVVIIVDPALRPADIVQTALLVTVDLPGETGVVNRIPIHLACGSQRTYLPTVMD